MQGVFLNFEKEQEIRVNDPFSEMKKLKYLKIWNGNFSGNTKYLSNELALLEWHACPLNSLPSGFESDKLVELKLHSSCIKQLWTGEKVRSQLVFWMYILEYNLKLRILLESTSLSEETLLPFLGCIP